MPILDLPQSARDKVWLRTVEILKTDETLAKTIQTFIVWDGTKISYSPDLSSMMPVLRLMPIIGPQSWYSPDAQYGWLNISILMSIQTRYASDYLNLWSAVENAIYPYGRQDLINARIADFVELGCETGLYEFSLPPMNPDPRQTEDGILATQGQMRISVIRSLSP